MCENLLIFSKKVKKIYPKSHLSPSFLRVWRIFILF